MAEEFKAEVQHCNKLWKRGKLNGLRETALPTQHCTALRIPSKVREATKHVDQARRRHGGKKLAGASWKLKRLCALTLQPGHSGRTALANQGNI